MRMFKDSEIKTVQTTLLSWYQKSHRKLPWRDQTNITKEQIFYNVLTSEIMSQQTKSESFVSD
jgi:adenine-specific DNA glycosylase